MNRNINKKEIALNKKLGRAGPDENSEGRKGSNKRTVRDKATKKVLKVHIFIGMNLKNHEFFSYLPSETVCNDGKLTCLLTWLLAHLLTTE